MNVIFIDVCIVHKNKEHRRTENFCLVTSTQDRITSVYLVENTNTYIFVVTKMNKNKTFSPAI